MKIKSIAAVASCICLVSCVTPYDDYGGDSTMTTTYYQPGYWVNSLPGGYRTEVISGRTYYYQNGNYYRRSSGGYVVTDAPRKSRYYQEYGRMREVGHMGRGDSQRVHDQRHQRGDFLPQLPRGYRVVTLRGGQYYQVGNRYYIRDRDGYSAVRNPY